MPATRRDIRILPDALPVIGTSPCTAHACRACCFDTEMPLLDDDLARLAGATGKPVDTFSEPDPQGGRRLRNEDGHCVFLGPAGCTVYDARPAGCRMYPLVWDDENADATLDADCPYRAGFRPRPKDRAALLRLVHRLQRDPEQAPRDPTPS